MTVQLSDEVTEREPVVPARDELEMLRAVLQTLASTEAQELVLAAPGGSAVSIPRSLVQVMRRAAYHLARDAAVNLVSYPKHLSLHAAAALLYVPVPYLTKLLDEGAIGFTEQHSVRLIDRDELLAYKRVQDERQREALDELTRLSEELGLYEKT